jgi:tRNA(fMet)-specific endonuclease VapC
MIVLDTDILTLYFRNHPRVVQKVREAEDRVVTSIISRMEILERRFANLRKAADSIELQRAQERLDQAEHDLGRLTVVIIDAAATAEFDRLRENRRLRKIGRTDLLIASIALANDATLVTRNVKDFRQVPGLRVENWAD